MTKQILALMAAGVFTLGVAAQQPAEAFVGGSTAAEANRSAQNDLSAVEEVRKRHRHRHHRHRHHSHNWFWAAPFIAAPFLFGPSCDRYWSRRYGRWIERCW
jgi:hypothetical protein